MIAILANLSPTIKIYAVHLDDWPCLPQGFTVFLFRGESKQLMDVHGRYEERFYRKWSKHADLYRFEVQNKQSDLLILCDLNLKDEATRALFEARRDIEETIARAPLFASTLAPMDVHSDSSVIHSMVEAGRLWNVGPMAAVAGAVSEYVGRSLLRLSARSVFVENGGDIFAMSDRPVRFGLYAGEESPFKDKLTFAVPAQDGIGICTSSGKVGPSLSFGKADAVVAVHQDAAVADAAATAVANQIKTPDDVARVVEKEGERGLLLGLIACCGDKLGMWGDLELVQ
jgi:ApbE superfamily uncharacterized protein (UPF0280 family)